MNIFLNIKILPFAERLELISYYPGPGILSIFKFLCLLDIEKHYLDNVLGIEYSLGPNSLYYYGI